jgi:RHS repeat-associated protein
VKPSVFPRISGGVKRTAFAASIASALSLTLIAAQQEPKTSAATVPPKVKVNRTVPKVTPAPLRPAFSAEPTVEEIFRARVFEEPLVPVGAVPNPSETKALAAAINAYLDEGGGESLSAMRRFLEQHPSSPWRASVLAGSGVVYRRTGHFSRALAAWEEAWTLTRASTEPRAKAIGDGVVGHLFELNARLGRFDVLERLFQEIDGRDIRGAATEKVSGARQALWLMHERTGEAFRCGPLAINEILRTAKPGAGTPTEIELCKSTKQGTSLLQLRDLAKAVGRPMRLARREAGARVLIPAVVHWRVGHFAALVAAEGDRYLVRDPTFGDEMWIRQSTVDAEASGAFLVDEQSLVPGWTPLDDTTAANVWGKGVAAGVDESDLNDGPYCGGGNCGGGGPGPAGPPPGRGMAVAAIHMMLVSIRLDDTPVGYIPAFGPRANFILAYNQRDAFQPQIPSFSNLGSKWTFDWMSYVEDDPANLAAAVTLYQRGGGKETSTGYNSPTQAYAPTTRSQAVVRRTSTSPIRYEREMPDGSMEVFAQPDGGSTFPRRVFLTAIKDPRGNALTFTWDSSLRLVAATDAAGLVTTLSYTHADPLKITRVTDPFGRFASFDYDSMGRLQTVTDVIGLQSSFGYGSADTLLTLTTPYGTTTFTSGEKGISRWAEMTDPLGRKERVQYGFGLTFAEPSSAVPVGMGVVNAYLDHHNTLYWGPHAMAKAPGEAASATDYHWALVESGAYQAAAVPLSIKRPLENRVWLTYQGPSTTREGSVRKPKAIGRVLDDGTSQITSFEYNDRGNITKRTDPAGRVVTFHYAANSIDLTEVRRWSGGVSTVVESRTYDSSHNLLSATDALGNSLTYTYNAKGQLQTATGPPAAGQSAGPITTYAYNANDQMITADDSRPGTTVSFTYDTLGRTRTQTDHAGLTLTFDYDGLDRPTKTTYPDSSYSEIVYDRLDPVRWRDREGNWTHTLRDAARRLVSVNDARGGTTTFHWCQCGSVERLIDGAGNATTNEYDIAGRLTKKTRANGTFTTYTYENTTSRPKTVVDRAGTTTTLAFNADDSIASKSFSDGTPTITYTYDAVTGLLASAASSTDTLTWTYDAIDRAVTEHSSKNGHTLGFTFDAAGNRTLLKIDGVALQSYAYDEWYRPTTIGFGTTTFTYAYNNQSRVSSLTFPNGVVTSYGYDGESRLSTIGSVLSSTPIVGFSYAYDKNSNRTEATEGSNTTAYKYDRLSRLREALRSTGTPIHSVYSYDAAGNRLGEQTSTGLLTSNLNGLNELLGRQPGGQATFAGTLSEPAAVSVDGKAAAVGGDNTFVGAATLTSGVNTVTVQATDPNANTKTNTYQVTVPGSGDSYGYDLNGNVISKTAGGHVWTYEWNALGQLTRVLKDSTEVARFAYDPFGRRVEKVSGGVTTKYLVDSGNVLREARSDGTNATFIHPRVLDAPLAKVDQAGVASYYHLDGLDSVSKLTNGSGVVVQSVAYDAWGNFDGASPGSGLAFNSREWDGETELYYYRARYLDPRTGRFLSEDPVPTLTSLYMYARGNPTSRVDPTGMVTVKCKNCGDREKQVLDTFKSFCNKVEHDPSCAGAAARANVVQCYQKLCFEDQTVRFSCGAPSDACGGYGGGMIVLHPSAFSKTGCGSNNTDLMGTMAHEFVHHCVKKGGSPPPDCDTRSICGGDESRLAASLARMKLVEDGCGGFGRR